MVDLTLMGLDAYWRDVSRSAPCVIDSMEAVEDWVLDHYENVDAEVIELGNSLPDVTPHFMQFENRDKFINDFMVVLAYLRASRALRLVRWAESSFSEFDFLEEVNRLYNEQGAEKIDRVAFKVMMDRLRFMWKTYLLHTIFAPERIEAVKDAVSQLEVRAS